MDLQVARRVDYRSHRIDHNGRGSAGSRLGLASRRRGYEIKKGIQIVVPVFPEPTAVQDRIHQPDYAAIQAPGAIHSESGYCTVHSTGRARTFHTTFAEACKEQFEQLLSGRIYGIWRADQAVWPLRFEGGAK